ncbi:MAG: hypothetical protein AB8B74_00855 [Crocinitomicaceae bacterium]
MNKLLNSAYSVFIATSAILFLFYHKVLLNLNGYVFAPDGDGIKNYYTYMFQAKNGVNFWEFKGMNYPFYEHIVYTDAHPLLSYIILKLGLVNQGVGILNGLMLLSFPLAAILIYKIFKHYKVSGVWSFFAAISICFLAPQVFRLTGHLSLSYSFAIPLMWYLILKTSYSKSFIWPLLIFITLFIFFFTHPYLGLILAVFGLFYAMVFWFFDRQNWKKITFKMVLSILSAIGLFRGIILLTDTHVDRMGSPTGFFAMYAKWNSLLVPHHGPMNKIKHLLNWRMSMWESWSYLGLFVISIMLFLIGYYFKNRKEINLKSLIKTPAGKMYLVGHLVLLFSFCFPLKYSFLRWIVDVLGSLQQFRVLGRFVWVYFYIASIISIVVLYRIMLQSTKHLYFKVFFYLGCAFSVLEFYPLHIGVSKAISRQENPFQKQHLSAELDSLVNWTKTQDYDAILFLPFSHLSSENIFLLGSEKSSYNSFLLSYHTNLPLLNTVSSRTSVTEAIAFHNLFSPEFVEKTFHHLLPSDVKVMLVKNKGVLNKDEMRMVYSSESIYKNDEFTVYDFSFEKWNDSYYFKEVKAKFGKADIKLDDGWYADTAQVEYVYDSFDSISEKNTFAGKGAFAAQKNGFHIIKENIKLKTGDYICSFWYNFRIDRADQLAVIEQTFKDSHGQWVEQNSMRESNHIVGDWLMVEIPFSVSDSVVSTKILLSGNKNKKWFILDELLIRKQNDTPLFKEQKIKGEAYLVYNNFRLKANSFSK